MTGMSGPDLQRELITRQQEIPIIFITACTDDKFRARVQRLGLSMSHATPIVFVVDDDVSVRESLESLIRCEGWHPEVFASAEEFLARPRVFAASCLVLDVTLPDLNGLDLQRRIADRIEMPIIFVTGRNDVPTTVQAMKSGAVEFLIKPFSCDALLNAMRNAIALSHAELGREAEQEALLDHYALLSRREREVMALVVRGRLNKQVGGELGISEITVKAHRGQVMRKMRANSFVDLVNMATKLNNIHDPNRQRRVLQTVLPWLRNTGARGVGANELDC